MPGGAGFLPSTVVDSHFLMLEVQFMMPWNAKHFVLVST